MNKEGFVPAVEDRPAVTVDIVLFSVINDWLNVLLVKRRIPPFVGMWALPGGFVRRGETLEEAALRELSEETGVSGFYLEQLYTFGDPGRDPRMWIVTVAYYALVNSKGIELRPATDVVDTAWYLVDNLPELAFDHARIIQYAVKRLRSKLEYTTVGFELLPEKFTLTELQRVYEAILGQKIDKRNFRKKMLSRGILQPLDETKMEGVHRPAKLYRFLGV
ncbi:MAG: NUDIX domain-containing protein [Acidobacteriota bacterium]|nr:NUDIX hydrolase [Blastocatellia bacterium]MDW8413140.1 NUDIX domain-containing protein [Acidobacteriota bacterium]